MSTVFSNDLQALLDQLSIDYATGKNLNVISGNYGLQRPNTGFDDAIWRAATKILAAQYKQISTKFFEILTLVQGPQATLYTNLSENHPIGSTVLKVNNVEHLPQVGTVVLDRGLATEESLRYVRADAYTSSLILEDGTFTAFAHVGVPDASTLLINASGTSSRVMSAAGFPLSGSFTPGTLSLLLSPGLPEEETVTYVTGNEGTFTLTSSALTHTHTQAPVFPKITNLAQAFVAGTSPYLKLASTAWLPTTGLLVLNGTSWVEFVSVDYTENLVELKYPYQSSLASGTVVELLPATRVAALAGVQVLGTTWSISQGSLHTVEIEIPLSEADLQDLRSASYIHGTFTPPTPAVVSQIAPSGSFYVRTNDLTNWPLSGVITFSGNYVGYSLHRANLLPSGLRQGLFYVPHTTPITLNIADTLTYTEAITWKGPYVFDPSAHSAIYTGTTLSAQLSAPSKLALTVNASASPAVLEVLDASKMPSIAFTAIAGLETFNVTSKNLASASTTTLSANATDGDMSVTVTSGAGFPNAVNFRVVLSGSNPEIVFVASRSGNVLNLAYPLQFSKSIGDQAKLVSDCLTVTQIDTKHTGLVGDVDRVPVGTSPTPVNLINYFNYNDAEDVAPLYSAITLASVVGFATNGGTVILRYPTIVEPDEILTYTSVVGSTLTFSPAISFSRNHLVGENVYFSTQLSEPVNTGTDYPLRMPDDGFDQLAFLLDLIRAAGIQVKINFKWQAPPP